MCNNQPISALVESLDSAPVPSRARGSSDDDLYKTMSRTSTIPSALAPTKAMSESASRSFDGDSGSDTVSIPCEHPHKLTQHMVEHHKDLPLRLTIGFCGSRRCSLCTLSPNRLAMLFHVAVLLAAFVGALVGIHFKEVFLPSIQKMSSSISRNWADISEAAGRRFSRNEDGLFDEHQTLWGKITSVLSIWPVVALMIFVLLTRVKLESDPSKTEEKSEEVLTDILSASPADSIISRQSGLVRCRNLNEQNCPPVLTAAATSASTSATGVLGVASVYQTAPTYRYPSADLVGEKIANRFSVAALNAVEGSDLGSTESNPALDPDAYEMAFNSMLLPTTAPNSLNLMRESYQSMNSTSVSTSAGGTGAVRTYASSINSSTILRNSATFPNPYQSAPLTIPQSFLTSHPPANH